MLMTVVCVAIYTHSPVFCHIILCTKPCNRLQRLAVSLKGKYNQYTVTVTHLFLFPHPYKGKSSIKQHKPRR